MDENVFWLRLWVTIVTGFVILVLAGVVSHMREDALIADMVLKGVDPIAAKCAYSSSTDNTLCVTHLISKK